MEVGVWVGVGVGGGGLEGAEGHTDVTSSSSTAVSKAACLV